MAYSATESEYLQFIESNGEVILETYRVPEGEDLSYWGMDRDTYFYKTLDSDLEAKAPYWTKGYFNNDGYLDLAFTVANSTSHKVFENMQGRRFYFC